MGMTNSYAVATCLGGNQRKIDPLSPSLTFSRNFLMLQVHVLPQEMLGRSTFGLSMQLLKWLPVRLVDQILLLICWFILGDTDQLGLKRPKLGPLELKSVSGKTPVLDVGTISKIRGGKIKVVRGIKRLMRNSVEFVDGTVENFDAIVLATGYRSNVPTWLKENDFFSEKNGFPCEPFPNGWKGGNGLYAVGFNRRGIFGSSIEARKIAEDIGNQSRPCNFGHSEPPRLPSMIRD